MPQLRTQADLRTVQQLHFCYLCGRTFQDGDTIDRDHVPPKAIFHERDRECPLVLPTHKNCNQEQSVSDEAVSQFIAAVRGKHPDPKNFRLEVQPIRNAETGNRMLALKGRNVKRLIARCLKAFHAALYGQFLPNEGQSYIHPPLPSGEISDDEAVMHDILPQHEMFVEQIKKDRIAQALDRIECFNEKCKYECAWHQFDNGRWGCFFALQIYDWKELGDDVHFPRRGCVGFYRPLTGMPCGATRGTDLEFPFANLDRLDAFGD